VTHFLRPRLFLCLALLAGASLSTSARAQEEQLPVFSVDDFSAVRFYTAPGVGNFFMVDSTRMGGDLLPQLGATIGYAHRPFAADELDCVTQAPTGSTTDPNSAFFEGDPLGRCSPRLDRPVEETDLSGGILNLQVYGAFVFAQRFQVGLQVPVILYADNTRYAFQDRRRNASDEIEAFSQTAGIGGSFTQLGDPRLHLKVRILDPGPPDQPQFSLGVAAYVSAPLGQVFNDDPVFLGDELPNAGGHLIGDLVIDNLRLAINLGGVFRGEATNIRSSVGPEVTWGIAGAYRLARIFEVMVEATGALGFDGSTASVNGDNTDAFRFDTEAPTEVRLGGNLQLDNGLTFHLGVGAGVFYGVGVPVFRAFGGASWSPPATGDSDGDGIEDREDGCPTSAEDMDGFEDEDGCPDLDNDGDGIRDTDDSCPNEAEDLDDEADEDGCPDLDDDGDGISDGYDGCPSEPEDMDGDRDNDGCPDYDADQDGIDDDVDECPSEAEDYDGWADEDGCPEEDFDGDGIIDDEDACPDQPEDMDGFQDGDGCPEAGGRGRRRRRRR
jgi:OOP family OmpA-OmpF porin